MHQGRERGAVESRRTRLVVDHQINLKYMALICLICILPALTPSQSLLSVVVMDEPAQSGGVAVSAELTGAQRPSQIAAPSGIAQLQNANDLPMSLVNGSSGPRQPS